MKVLERVLEKRIRCQVPIDNMQFGFMPGKGTTDAIFIMRQVQEKHQPKNKKLDYVVYSPSVDRVGLPLPNIPSSGVLIKSIEAEFLRSNAVSNSTKYCILSRTQRIQLYTFV